jgi:hypothetical protein
MIIYNTIVIIVMVGNNAGLVIMITRIIKNVFGVSMYIKKFGFWGVTCSKFI